MYVCNVIENLKCVCVCVIYWRSASFESLNGRDSDPVAKWFLCNKQ